MKKKESLWSRNYLLLVAAEFLIFFNFAMESTTLSQYLVSKSFTIGAAGIIVGAMSISALLCRPLIGWMCDCGNRKKLFLVAIVIYALTIYGYTITESYSGLVILRIIHGLAFGIATTLIMVLLGENIPKERMGKGWG